MSRERWASREALQHVVYGTPEGQGLTQSPYFPPEYNTIKARAQSTLDSDGKLLTGIAMDLSGYACTYLRRYAEKYPVPELRAEFEHVLNIAPNVKLEELDFTDPYDYSRDARVDMKVSAEGYAAGVGEVRMFQLPLMTHPLAGFLMPDFSYDFSADERQYGMRMRATRLVIYEETIKLPAGWKIEHLPEAKTLDSGSVSLTFEAKAGDGELTYRFEMALKNNVIPPEDYPGWKEAIEAMSELTDTWIVCKVSS